MSIALPPLETEQVLRRLEVLRENPGRVLTRAMLEARLYSWGEEVASNAIEVHIHHLRRKLGNDFIKTIRGVGYQVSAPAKGAETA